MKFYSRSALTRMVALIALLMLSLSYISKCYAQTFVCTNVVDYRHVSDAEKYKFKEKYLGSYFYLTFYDKSVKVRWGNYSHIFDEEYGRFCAYYHDRYGNWKYQITPNSWYFVYPHDFKLEVILNDRYYVRLDCRRK